jgi:NADPH:quinone reductase
MKAILVRDFIAPEVLKLEKIPTPQPAAGHALVRVNAAGVNLSFAKTPSGRTSG